MWVLLTLFAKASHLVLFKMASVRPQCQHPSYSHVWTWTLEKKKWHFDLLGRVVWHLVEAVKIIQAGLAVLSPPLTSAGGVLGHNCHMDTHSWSHSHLWSKSAKTPPRPKYLHKSIPWYVLKKTLMLVHIHTCTHSHTWSCSSADALPLRYCPNTKCFKTDFSVQADPSLSSQALSKSLFRHDGLDQIRHSPHVHLMVHW